MNTKFKEMKTPKYFFVEKINGTTETGVVDVSTNPPTILCLCTKENSKIILKKLQSNINGEKELDEEKKELINAIHMVYDDLDYGGKVVLSTLSVITKLRTKYIDTDTTIKH